MGISFLQFLEIIVFSFHINIMETNLKLVILGIKEHSLLKRSHNVTLEQKKIRNNYSAVVTINSDSFCDV